MNVRIHKSSQQESHIRQSPEIGERLAGKSDLPDESTVRDWMGPETFEHWSELRGWIEICYPGVFTPDWIYGGKKRGWALRYKKIKAFCTLMPAYKQLSVQVVLGRAERERFEQLRYFWSPQLVKLYDEARPYPDGKWLTVTISSEADRQELTELVSMKRPPLALAQA